MQKRGEILKMLRREIELYDLCKMNDEREARKWADFQIFVLDD